jgi:hypothetical protein
MRIVVIKRLNNLLKSIHTEGRWQLLAVKLRYGLLSWKPTEMARATGGER